MKIIAKNDILKIVCFVIIILASGNSLLAQASIPATTDTPMLSLNTALAGIAVLLLFIIIILGMTVNSAVDLYKQNAVDHKPNSKVSGKALLFAGFMLLSGLTFAQIQEPAKVITNPASMMSGIYTYSFTVIIIAEVLIILFFFKALRFLTGIEARARILMQAEPQKSLWEQLNQFKPIEEEANMDTGHNYDGIRELDNITPPWFIAGFVASILFALIYIYRYDIAHSAPSQLEEYTAEVNEAKIIQDSLLKLEGNKVDENSVAMLGADGIASGAKVYAMNCLACHGNKGQGGVGPNLTDDYWIHGGNIQDVFKSIKYGWVEKGMKSWKDDFSPTQIAQLASFVKSLKGTHPAGAKEKQGELFTETINSSSAILVAAVKSDTMKAN